jgi:hypothetical protein
MQWAEHCQHSKLFCLGQEIRTDLCMVHFLGSSMLTLNAVYMFSLCTVRHVLPHSLAIAFLAGLTVHITYSCTAASTGASILQDSACAFGHLTQLPRSMRLCDMHLQVWACINIWWNSGASILRCVHFQCLMSLCQAGFVALLCPSFQPTMLIMTAPLPKLHTMIIT